MNPFLALLAASAGSILQGISTVQQKIGADKEKNVKTFDIALLLRLSKNIPYLMGIIIEIIGYGLSLIALRILPLFLVQSILAASVVVTAIAERIFLHRRISSKSIKAILIVMIGLILLSMGAEPSKAKNQSQTVLLLLELSPLILGILGIVFIYMKNKISASLLAIIGGLAYGNTSTIGRIFIYPHHLMQLIYYPLFWGLIASAIIGQYFFTIALQRASAIKGNSIMITAQTLGPALIGLIYLNDKIQTDFIAFVIIGAILVIGGSLTIASDNSIIES